MENNINKDLNTSEDQEIEFFEFGEDLQHKENVNSDNQQVEVVQMDENTRDDDRIESSRKQSRCIERRFHVPTVVDPSSMSSCKIITDNALIDLFNAVSTLKNIKVPYSDVSSIINGVGNTMAGVYNELSDLSQKLGSDIVSSLEIDVTIASRNDMFTNFWEKNGMVVENTEFIYKYGSCFGYTTYLGNFYIQYLANGRSYIQAKQNLGNWKQIKLPNGKYYDHTGSCSIFMTASAASYLLNDTSPELMRSIMLYNSGMFDGARTLFSGGIVLKDDTGQKFVINSTVSEKQLSYGSNSNKTAVIDDWKATLANDGVILLNITARSDEEGNVINTNAHISSGVERDEETGLLKAKGGHMIAIMGVSPEGYVIFSDSLDDGAYYKKNANGTPMTLEEFYDSYGGATSTWGGDEYKRYITVENAEKQYVDASADLGFIMDKAI